MSRLSNILKKPIEVEFRGETFILTGLEGDKIDLFMDDTDDITPEQMKEKMFQLIFYALKPGMADITMEEVKALDIAAVNFFMKHVQKLNNIKPEEANEKAKDFVKERINNGKQIKGRQSEGSDIQQKEAKK